MTINKNMFTAFLALAIAFSSCMNDAGKTNDEPVQNSGSVSATESNDAKQLPLLNMVNEKGEPVSLNSFQGKKIFVNLWASWCGPCRREMPSIEKLYRSVDTAKVAFVLLALDDDFEKSKKYMASQKLNLPLYYPAENLPALFNVPGIPTTFIFGEQGQLIQKIEGSDDYDRDEYRKILK